MNINKLINFNKEGIYREYRYICMYVYKHTHKKIHKCSFNINCIYHALFSQMMRMTALHT